MGKLLQRLSDPSRSGVYRAARIGAILDATQGSRLHVARIPLAGVHDKTALLARVSRELRFPAWFAENWDALEDCLADLSWIDAAGHVLLIEQSSQLAGRDLAVFSEVLGSAARQWAERGHPFFAVFIEGSADLPPLWREEAPRS